MFEIFLALILLFIFPEKGYCIKTQQYPKSRRFGWRELPRLTVLWWKLKYYLFRMKTIATFNNPADFVISQTADFDAGTKSNTTTITDDYEGATDAIKLSSPPRKKDANDKGVWLMSEGSGDVVADSSGNGNHGTAYGATIVSGKFGNARSFDGNDDYVDCGTGASISNNTVGTVIAYIKLTSTGTERGFFDVSNKAASTTRSNLDFDKIVSDYIYVTLRKDGTVYWRFHTTTYTVPAGSWVQVVLVQDGTSPVLYINGSLVDITWDTTIDKTMWYNAIMTEATYKANAIAIGGAWYNNNIVIPWLGTLDEYRIINRALSASEITALYNSGLQYVTSGNWKSATKTIASDEKLKVLTVSHTGLSGTYSIQYKILKSSDGSVLWSSLVLTSGTTEHWHESDFGIITDEGIQIQRIFAGDGAGTAVGGRIDGICTGIDNLRCIDVNMKDAYVRV